VNVRDRHSNRNHAGDGEPINILFLHASSDLYGSDKILLSIINDIDRTKFRPLVVLPVEGPLVDRLRQMGVEVLVRDIGILRLRYYTPLGMLNRLYNIVCGIWFLRKTIREHAIRLVHTHTSPVLAGAFASRLTGVPHVWHIFEIRDKPHTVWRIMAWLIVNLPTETVATSMAVKKWLCRMNRRTDLPGVRVIYNGIDTDGFSSYPRYGTIRKEYNIPEDRIVVGMIARVCRWKGQNLFIESARIVREKYPDVLFMLVGGVYEPERYVYDSMLKQIADYQMDDCTLVTGFHDNIAEVYAALDVFVIPSTQPDPFPTTVLEAMVSQKPVVGCDHGGISEMIEDNVTGYLVEPNNPEAMAEAICKTLADTELRRRMGEAGRQRYETEFAQDRFIREMEQLYETVVLNVR